MQIRFILAFLSMLLTGCNSSSQVSRYEDQLMKCRYKSIKVDSANVKKNIQEYELSWIDAGLLGNQNSDGYR